jgi:hypothetical protein
VLRKQLWSLSLFIGLGVRKTKPKLFLPLENYVEKTRICFSCVAITLYSLNNSERLKLQLLLLNLPLQEYIILISPK